jgi:anti-sigma B factor antagonist
MKYEVDIKEDCAVVNLSGDIDLSCSDGVRKILLDTVVKTPLILFDLSDVSVIDSSGVSSLLDGEQTAKSVEISLNW